MTTSLSDLAATAEGRVRSGQVIRGEWVKFWSVPRWVLAMLAAIVLTVLMSVLSASGSGTDENSAIWDLYVPGPDGRPVQDSFHFVHQPASGDLTITAQVVSQEGRSLHAAPAEVEAGAMAGLVIKESAEAGSAYAAIVVTPGEGVRMHANFETELTGSTQAAARWLRLTRTGATITGFESADGTQWSEVGKVDVTELPDTVEVGMLVGSPDAVVVERQFGSTAVGQTSTISAAEFDNVSLEPAGPVPGVVTTLGCVARASSPRLRAGSPSSARAISPRTPGQATMSYRSVSSGSSSVWSSSAPWPCCTSRPSTRTG